MFQKLLKLSNGATVLARPVYLRKRLRCKRSGRWAHLQRVVPLHPVGLRGYYTDGHGNTFSVDRKNVSRIVKQSGDRVWLV